MPSLLAPPVWVVAAMMALVWVSLQKDPLISNLFLFYLKLFGTMGKFSSLQVIFLDKQLVLMQLTLMLKTAMLLLNPSIMMIMKLLLWITLFWQMLFLSKLLVILVVLSLRIHCDLLNQ